MLKPTCSHLSGLTLRRLAVGAGMCACALGALEAAEVTEAQWREVLELNAQLRSQVTAHQRELAVMRERVERLEQEDRRAEPAVATSTAPRAGPVSRVILSGETGLAFFAGGSDSWYPNEEFRVADAYLRVEAEVFRQVYLFGELQLSKRETRDENIHLDQYYVEFEDVLAAWGQDGLLSVRFGRFDIPFGEEYLQRDPLANPLVQHALSDIWGIDEGIEFFGAAGPMSYVFAVQNGSQKVLHDYDSDKQLTVRLGYDPHPRVHVSVSAMRTGDLNAANEFLSEIWIGQNVFRPIGSSRLTTYGAELYEVDASYRWSNGHVAGALGRARYTDDDPLADNTRRLTYFFVEGVQTITGGFYAAARYSQLHAEDGYPLTGLGEFNKYFLSGLLTEDLWRLSLGGGYRFNPSLVLKTEYTFERGDLIDGTTVRDRDQLSVEAAVGF